MKRRTMQLISLSLFAALSTVFADVELLIYETDRSLANSNLVNVAISGMHATIVGEGQKFAGFGSKYSTVLPALRSLPPTTLTIVSDGRDVLLNHVADSHRTNALENFERAFEKLTAGSPNAIVLSAEAQCCVSALTYAEPGDYFDETGSRSQRACFSGKSGCLWNGDDKAVPWEVFMKELAKERNAGSREDIYLNAGLMVGRASDLIRVLSSADIGENEDDQAVLTDYMYRHTKEILLDYDQELFGNNRDVCMFELHDDQLVHKHTRASPLLIHSPGSSTMCHEDLMAELGQEAASLTSRRRLTYYKSTSHNYGECKYGYKWASGSCVKDWCYADYQCPAGSIRIPDRECYNNFDDCKCKHGYCKVGDKCKKS